MAKCQNCGSPTVISENEVDWHCIECGADVSESDGLKRGTRCFEQ